MEPVRANISPALPVADARLTPAVAPAGDVDFESVLRNVVEHASATDRAATERVEALAAGTSDDIHGTMLAVKEAEIGVRLVGSIRNKLLDAFHEIWRTGV